MSNTARTVRLKVSPEVARIVGKGAPREVRMTAARGALPLPVRDLVTALFFLRHGADPEIKAQAKMETVSKMQAAASDLCKRRSERRS